VSGRAGVIDGLDRTRTVEAEVVGWTLTRNPVQNSAVARMRTIGAQGVRVGRVLGGLINEEDRYVT
jgi:hypothetical protein